MKIEFVEFGSPAQLNGVDFDWEIISVITPNIRPRKEWTFVPVMLLALALWFNQRRRTRRMKVLIR